MVAAYVIVDEKTNKGEVGEGESRELRWGLVYMDGFTTQFNNKIDRF